VGRDPPGARGFRGAGGPSWARRGLPRAYTTKVPYARAGMNARFAEVHARLSELREDLREIRGMLQTTPKIATRFLGTPVPLR